MTREILLHNECTALADRYGLADLCAQANALHARTQAAPGAWTPIVIVRALLLDVPAGEAAILFAFAGTRSEETEGCEGVQLMFTPDELSEIPAVLARESQGYDERFIADDLAERIRAAGDDNQS